MEVVRANYVPRPVTVSDGGDSRGILKSFHLLVYQRYAEAGKAFLLFLRSIDGSPIQSELFLDFLV